jgi:hypothetical protein
MQKIKHCNLCNVVLTKDNTLKSMMDNHHYRCIDCHNKINEKSNRLNMYVNSKYISRKHPLYKPGNYKSFGEAAFTALQKDERVREGHVYAISNPAWPEWIKIGMAIDAEDRLNGYQTSSPMRDYDLIHSISTQDRGRLERIAHKAAAKCGERQGEWFKITSEQAVTILDSIKEDVVDGQS